jgi:RNA polymerase sigma-70 factor (ECF subfamily)
MAAQFPSPEEACAVYGRLLRRDPTAPSDLAVAFLECLSSWLTARSRNQSVPEDLIHEAAEDAILSLIRNPSSFRAETGDLVAYLKMSAQGDLLNRLRREAKHRQGRTSLERVEQSDQAGKYLGREADPSLPMQVEEHLSRTGDPLPNSVRRGLTDAEARVLDLMMQGERKTSVYAQAYGIAGMESEAQRRMVKQVKDKLKKRLDRARRNDEQAS